MYTVVYLTYIHHIVILICDSFNVTDKSKKRPSLRCTADW